MKPLATIEEIEPIRDYLCDCVDLCYKVYKTREEELLKTNEGDMALIIPAHQLEGKKHLLIVGPSKPSFIDYIKEIYPNIFPHVQGVGRETMISGPRG